MRKHNQVLMPNQGLDEYTKVCIQANDVNSLSATTQVYSWSQLVGLAGFTTITSMFVSNDGKYIWVTGIAGTSQTRVSRDYGNTFATLDPAKYAVLIPASNAGAICYAVNNSNSQMYITNNGGYDWQKLTCPYNAIHCVSENGNIVVVAASGSSNNPVYISRDFGQTWNNVTTPIKDAIVALGIGKEVGYIGDVTISSNGKYVVAIVNYDSEYGSYSFRCAIAYSSDYGATWTGKLVNASPYASVHSIGNAVPMAKSVAINNDGQIIVCGGHSWQWVHGSYSDPVFTSKDAGDTWSWSDPLSSWGAYGGFMISKNNYIYAKSGANLSAQIARSTTSGVSWDLIGPVMNNNGANAWNIIDTPYPNINTATDNIIYTNPLITSAIFANYTVSPQRYSNVFTDSSIYSRTLTGTNEAYVKYENTAKFNGRNVVIGNYSGTYSNAGYISVPYSTDLGLSHDNRTSATLTSFSIDTWVKQLPVNVSGGIGDVGLFSQYVTSANLVSWNVTSGSMNFLVVDNGTITANYSTLYTPVTGQWDHLSVKRNAEKIAFVINGTEVSSTVTTPILSSYAIPTFNTNTIIGQDLNLTMPRSVSNSCFNDYRISIGTSRNNYPISHNRPYIDNNIYDKTGIDEYTKIYFSGDKLVDESYYKNPVVIYGTYLSGDAPIFENCFGYNGDSVYVAAPVPGLSGLSGMNPLAQDFAVNFWFKDGPLYGTNQEIRLCGHWIDFGGAGFQILYYSWPGGYGAPYLKMVGQSGNGIPYGNLFNVKTSAGGFNPGQWNHVAFVRDTANTNFNLYCNGSLVKQVSGISTSINVSNTTNFYTAGPSCFGQVALLQYDIGTTRGWTGSTITIPSTTDLSRIDSYTKLFYKGDSFTDLSQYNRTITSDTLSAQMINAQAPKFSNKIINLPARGTNYPGIAVNRSANPGIGIGQQDFAIDFWFKAYTMFFKQILFSSDSPSIGIDICDTNAAGTYGSLGMLASSNGSTWNLSSGSGTTFAFKANVWNHVAYTRNGSSLKLFLNGVLYTSASIAANSSIYNNNSNRILIGSGYYTGYFNFSGQISQFRYCVGTNRGWIGSSIIVPQKPSSPLGYPIDSKTSICINGESRAIEDADQSMYKRTVTII